MNDQYRVVAGAVLGALVGAAGSYLFFTGRGRDLRSRLEPAVDDFRGEFARFRKTIEKVGDMANEGLRMMEEFNAARSRSPYQSSTSH